MSADASDRQAARHLEGPNGLRTRGWYRYAPHASAQKYIDAGWIYEGQLPPPHGVYSVLLRACECRAAKFDREAA